MVCKGRSNTNGSKTTSPPRPAQEPTASLSQCTHKARPWGSPRVVRFLLWLDWLLMGVGVVIASFPARVPGSCGFFVPFEHVCSSVGSRKGFVLLVIVSQLIQNFGGSHDDVGW